jgi:hypothetical protein
MNEIHDPYLHAVRINLNDKQMKKRQAKSKKLQKEKVKSFLQRKVTLSDYINLPDGVQEVVFFLLFLVIPYVVGIVVIFFLVAKASLETYERLNMDSYFLSWTIGYEVLGLLVLLFITKMALTFKSGK